jgi:peptidoglycan hydrolase-like protein with peptidoglycan-binding domain
MASVGSVIKVGGTFFTIDEQPVVAMYGTLPAYRDMEDGDTGTDITQLQQSLEDLGYNPGGVDGTFGSGTVTAVEAWQTAEGLTVDGIVHLGQVVFVPGVSRVISQVATIGDTASSGTAILSIGPESPIVTTSESSTQLGLLSQGQSVDVQLPDNSIVVGKVTSVGAASSSSSSSSSGSSASGGSSSSSSSTSITIALDNPALGNSIAGSSVNVIVTTASVKDVLAVPLGALLATSSGDFIVQVPDATGSLANVSVTPTIYDDTSGIVAVPGARLTPGERVVVASS